MSQEVPVQVEQKQIVKTFGLSRWSVEEQLQSYLNENPSLRVVSMAVTAYYPNDKLLVVLEPVAEDRPPELIYPPMAGGHR